MTTDPTTPRPTDAAIALVREAVQMLEGDWTVGGIDITTEHARAILAHPALARVIAIGQAWVAAEGDRVLALSKDATPGPWSRDAWYIVAPKPWAGARPDEVIGQMSPTRRVAEAASGVRDVTNAALAVAAVNLVLALAAALADQERGS